MRRKIKGGGEICIFYFILFIFLIIFFSFVFFCLFLCFVEGEVRKFNVMYSLKRDLICHFYAKMINTKTQIQIEFAFAIADQTD